MQNTELLCNKLKITVYKTSKAWYTIYMMREQNTSRALAEYIRDGRINGRFVVTGKKPISCMPDYVAPEMLASAKAAPTDQVLILFTAEFLPILATMGFTDVTIATEGYDPFVRAITEACNSFLGTGYKYMTIAEIEEKNMKFDVVLGNPPYSGSGNPLYLQFLNKALNISKSKVVFLTPAAYLLDQKKENIHYNKARNAIANKVESVVIHAHNIFGLSSAAINGAVSTITIDLDKNDPSFELIYSSTQEKYIIDDIEKLNPYANYDIFFSIKEKMLLKAKELNAYDYTVNESNYFLNIPKLQRYKIISDGTISKTPTSDYGMYFDTYELAQAAKEYLQTPTAAFALHIYKVGMNIKSGRNLRSVPMFKTVNQYENYIEELGLTQDEVDFCQHINDNWRDYFFFS